MRICLDVSPAVHGRAGLGRYAQELATALLAVDSENEYVAFYNRAAEAQPQPPIHRLPRLTSGLGDKPWRLSVLISHLARLAQDHRFPGIDIFHGTDHLLPRLSRVRSVLTLHDLAFRFHPETHTALNRWFLTLLMPHFLRTATAIIADSQSTRRDAVRLYGVAEGRISVVPAGVSARFRPADAQAISAVRRRYGLPERFILFVGTIEPRKNLATLLAAYRQLLELGLDLRLVIVGKRGWRYQAFFRTLRELGLEGRIVQPGFVPDDDLPALYSAADLFVFPSLYEGFGLPVLEAMACGTPVICSNTSSLPEVAGNAALLLDPCDAQGWVQAMAHLVRDDDLRRTLHARGLEQAARFSWTSSAQATVQVYRHLYER